MQILTPSSFVAKGPEVAAEVQAKFFRGLGDATRLQIVRLLLIHPRSVGELVSALVMSQSRVSNHLACLKWCGLGTTQRRGRLIIYRLANGRIRALLASADAMIAENAAHIAACTRIDAPEARPARKRLAREHGSR